MARIVVGSFAIQFPMGGYISWLLQWLVGLQQLGHEVYFVERSATRHSCWDPAARSMQDDASAGIARVVEILARHQLDRNWCFVDIFGNYFGLGRRQVEDVFRSADLFLDMGSHGTWFAEAAAAGMRVLIDGEPGYRQILMQKALDSGATLPGNDYHYPNYEFLYTVGANIGTPASTAPRAGRSWRGIFDPVVVDMFPVCAPPQDAPFTTVMAWQAHEPIEYEGRVYGQKDVEFARFLGLPGRTGARLEVAIGGAAPVDELVAAGWRVRDSFAVTETFDSWRRYIRGSRGEFSVAKNVFVATNSGFFSDRSAVYLASGRPVVMQETGFSAHLPCGCGLFAVRTLEEAVAAIEEVQADYPRHSERARQVALEHLEARRVLGRLLSDIGL